MALTGCYSFLKWVVFFVNLVFWVYILLLSFLYFHVLKYLVHGCSPVRHALPTKKKT